MIQILTTDFFDGGCDLKSKGSHLDSNVKFKLEWFDFLARGCNLMLNGSSFDFEVAI